MFIYYFFLYFYYPLRCKKEMVKSRVEEIQKLLQIVLDLLFTTFNDAKVSHGGKVHNTCIGKLDHKLSSSSFNCKEVISNEFHRYIIYVQGSKLFL